MGVVDAPQGNKIAFRPLRRDGVLERGSPDSGSPRTRGDTPERQQTLRATIDWSHSLLTESEQRLFGRMAVFAELACRSEGLPSWRPFAVT
jgi:hypothetical protein